VGHLLSRCAMFSNLKLCSPTFIGVLVVLFSIATTNQLIFGEIQ
jgi:hypothetical protein